MKQNEVTFLRSLNFSIFFLFFWVSVIVVNANLLQNVIFVRVRCCYTTYIYDIKGVDFIQKKKKRKKNVMMLCATCFTIRILYS